jgi:hypothetical protein
MGASSFPSSCISRSNTNPSFLILTIRLLPLISRFINALAFLTSTLPRPTSFAFLASTSPNSSSFSSTSRSSVRTSRVCCGTVCRRATLLRSLRCVSLPSPLLLSPTNSPFPPLPLFLVQPESKLLTKLVPALSTFLVPSHGANKKARQGKEGQDDANALGEYASVMEGEYLDFVCFEVERVEGGKEQ